MEHSSSLILEISSDEEAGLGDSRKGSGYGGGDDDDDCVVLDGDPDKAVVMVNSKVDDDDSDSDDLKIVGEKGEVACRDFPHARHFCAKFIFASTPHEVHCGQCHCYVCDSLAPCPHWGTGISSIDHCHASDKEEYWKAERKRVMKGDKPVLVNSTTGSTSRLEAYFPASQVPALSRQQPNSFVESWDFNLVTVHSGAMSSSVNVPTVAGRVRIHPSGYAFPRSRYPEQPINENEIRIAAQGLIRNYVTYATSLFQDKREKEIILKAMGQAISKAVALAEIIKKRIPGLYQNISTSSITITDAYEPIEEGLNPLEIKRQVSLITIALSTIELNKDSPGYQGPAVNQAKDENQQEQQNRQSIISYTDAGEDNVGGLQQRRGGGRGGGRGRGRGAGYRRGRGGGRGRGRGYGYWFGYSYGNGRGRGGSNEA